MIINMITTTYPRPENKAFPPSYPGDEPPSSCTLLASGLQLLLHEVPNNLLSRATEEEVTGLDIYNQDVYSAILL